MSENAGDAELVIGLIAPVGVDLNNVETILGNYFGQFGYSCETVRLSSLIKKVEGLDVELLESPPGDRIDTYMTGGNQARELAKRGDFLAALGVYEVYKKRMESPGGGPLGRKAHIFRSLKHPDEVHLLRSVYGNGFYLLGFASSQPRRLGYLTEQLGIPRQKAEYLIHRDRSERRVFGQAVEEVFHLADAFIDIDRPDGGEKIGRVLDLVFGHPYITPEQDEYAMFLAYAASLRSADLSRQVGAVLVSEGGEIVSTGANDVPKYGGGLYWPDDELDERDYSKGVDSNEQRRDEIVLGVMKKVHGDACVPDPDLLEKGKKLLRDTGIFDITEFGRTVHAEMEALLSCGRAGVSPKGGTLYSTTFPCHNCTKHIIDAGVRRVVFVEPYPKSLAEELHSDAIVLAEHADPEEGKRKVKFEPFVGVGPRRFIDLFSTRLSGGRVVRRKKEGGTVVEWERSSASPRVPMVPRSYLDQEVKVATEADEITGGSYATREEEG